MKPIFFHSLIILILVSVCCLTTQAMGDYVPDSSRWDARVERYLAKDKEAPPPIGGVVFVGSSTIDMWPSLKTDFPDLPVVRRGIGGTWLADVTQFAPKLVYPLKPRIVVVYGGENDLNAKRTVEDVVEAFEAVLRQIHTEAPNASVVYLAIKPSPLRAWLLPAMREANRRIAALCAKDPLCEFVDVFTPMFDSKGELRSELFAEDKLHMNADAYRIWREIIRPVLARIEARRASAPCR